uniref:Uncharacterized protein n=1 Tax=Gouania willdenowi TaxID=441366 RepID=A0A8C5FZ18_GOUWI
MQSTPSLRARRGVDVYRHAYSCICKKAPKTIVRCLTTGYTPPRHSLQIPWCVGPCPPSSPLCWCASRKKWLASAGTWLLAAKCCDAR